MAGFNVSALEDKGYDAVNLGLEDPLDPRFAPKLYEGTDLQQVVTQLLPQFRGLGAYELRSNGSR